LPLSEQALAEKEGDNAPQITVGSEVPVMRIALLLALILMTGGFFGSTVYQSGQQIDHLSYAQLVSLGESAVVIAALMLPAALMLVAMMARGVVRTNR